MITSGSGIWTSILPDTFWNHNDVLEWHALAWKALAHGVHVYKQSPSSQPCPQRAMCKTVKQGVEALTLWRHAKVTINASWQQRTLPLTAVQQTLTCKSLKECRHVIRFVKAGPHLSQDLHVFHYQFLWNKTQDWNVKAKQSLSFLAVSLNYNDLNLSTEGLVLRPWLCSFNLY